VGPDSLLSRSGACFGFGGLWDRREKQAEKIASCTILIGDANEPMIAIYERLPVAIPPESFEVRLAPVVHDVGTLTRLLRPFHPDETTAYPVGALVNGVKVDAIQERPAGVGERSRSVGRIVAPPQSEGPRSGDFCRPRAGDAGWMCPRFSLRASLQPNPYRERSRQTSE
jgi:hypothetical protein